MAVATVNETTRATMIDMSRYGLFGSAFGNLAIAKDILHEAAVKLDDDALMGVIPLAERAMTLVELAEEVGATDATRGEAAVAMLGLIEVTECVVEHKQHEQESLLHGAMTLLHVSLSQVEAIRSTPA